MKKKKSLKQNTCKNSKSKCQKQIILQTHTLFFNPFATGDVYMHQLSHCLQWYAGSERVIPFSVYHWCAFGNIPIRLLLEWKLLINQITKNIHDSAQPCPTIPYHTMQAVEKRVYTLYTIQWTGS